MQATTFQFHGRHASEVGFLHVRRGGADAEIAFTGSRGIETKSLIHHDQHYITSLTREPIEFTLSLIPAKPPHRWTPQLFSQCASWLIHDRYLPFVSGDTPYKVYYVICDEAPTWEGVCDYGVATFHFVANASTGFTHPERRHVEVNGKKEVFIYNRTNVGDRRSYPRIRFTKTKGRGDISFINHTNGKKTMTIRDVEENEVVTVDTAHALISSDTPTNYLEKLTGDFFYLVEGENCVEITGDASVDFELQYAIV